MKITSSLFIGAVVLFLTACNNKGTESEETTATETTSATPALSPATDASVTNTPAPTGFETQPTLAAPQGASATAPGMNPPHGQPGHRCEIPVGAPLDSKAPPTNALNPATLPPVKPLMNFSPTVTEQTNGQSKPGTPPPTPNAPLPTGSVAEGTNPAHGQPGHRCEIPVGAPLNSEPVKYDNQQMVPPPANNNATPSSAPPHQ